MKVLDAKPRASDNVKLYTGHQSFDCNLPTALPASRLLVKKRQDTFTHYTASVLMHHIMEIYDYFRRIGNRYKHMI